MGDDPLRVLLVEDDEDDFLLTRDLLTGDAARPYEVDWVTDFDAALAAIGEARHDVYLLDFRLGARTGVDLIREAVGRGCRAPLILLTGRGDRETDIQAMRAGASDYLAKDRIDADRLERAVRYAVERKRAEDSLRRIQAELEDRVQERTADLARANDVLRAEVAERRRAEEAAEAASRAKSQFLAVLSHELRTPLTPALVALTALAEDPDTPDLIRPMLDVIRRNVELEARLIDDLLDVTRITQGKFSLNRETVDAHDLVRRAVEICRDEVASAGVRLEVDLAAGSHHVEGDPARLQQVVWNLVKNAGKFTPRGGTIAVRSRDAVGPGGPVWAVEVADTGIGIEPEALARIFDAFEQGDAETNKRFGGLGLGLAISRSLAEAHGGRLTARSEGRGRGATFALEVPAVPPPPPAAPDGAADDEARVAALRILLVEDNPDTRRVMTRLLRVRGHRVTAAAGVAKALEAAGRDVPFDLVVSDIGLPDGSGLDLMRALRAARPVPGIALSGFGMEDDVRKSREAGFDAHLIKPVDFATLEAAIQHAAARR